MVKFSIVIVARSMNHYIEEALPYFEKQTNKDFELIIVLEEKPTEKIKNAKVVISERASPAKARNIGAENAKGEIIAFIDDDAHPKEYWLENALKNFEDENIVAVGGPSLTPKNANFFQHVSNKVYELSSMTTGKRYGKGRKRKKTEIDEWPTCNFFVRKIICDFCSKFHSN